MEESTDGDDIVNSIEEDMFTRIFRVQDNTMETKIVSSKYMDPTPEDNTFTVIISSSNGE